MSEKSSDQFDFQAFKKALESLDLESWVEFYADTAEWIEYKHNFPPRSPRLMSGKKEIVNFLAGVKSSNVILKIEDEVIGQTRAACCLWVTLPDGKRIVENIIIHYSDGKITKQVDVEAWD